MRSGRGTASALDGYVGSPRGGVRLNAPRRSTAAWAATDSDPWWRWRKFIVRTPDVFIGYLKHRFIGFADWNPSSVARIPDHLGSQVGQFWRAPRRKDLADVGGLNGFNQPLRRLVPESLVVKIPLSECLTKEVSDGFTGGQVDSVKGTTDAGG